MSSPAVTVTVPSFGIPADVVARAVDSAVGPETRVVVVDDADPDGHQLRHLAGPGVVVVRFPTNEGSYWCRSVVQAASPDPWQGGVDGDDWCEPAMYRTLLAATGGVTGVLAGRWQQPVRRPPFPVPVPVAAVGTRTHPASHLQGIWSTGLVRRVGGYRPAARLGDDTRFLWSVTHAGRTRVLADLLYHYEGRAGSATSAADTRYGSPARLAEHRTRDAIWAAQERTPVAGWPALTAHPDPDLAARWARQVAALTVALAGRARTVTLPA